MKRLLFFTSLMFAFFCNSQSNSNLGYKTLLSMGDSAWKRNDVKAARNFYNEAMAYRSSSPEIDYRNKNVTKKYSLYWNDSINRFFKYLELGDYCSKDKCYRAAKSCYEKALKIASKKEYRCLKNTVHTKYARKRIRSINKWNS